MLVISTMLWGCFSAARGSKHREVLKENLMQETCNFVLQQEDDLEHEGEAAKE